MTQSTEVLKNDQMLKRAANSRGSFRGQAVSLKRTRFRKKGKLYDKLAKTRKICGILSKELQKLAISI